jgi:hypothetical protein
MSSQGQQLDKLVDLHLGQFKDHKLVAEENVRAYYLTLPGDRNLSCLVTFSPEGITLTGDITPGPDCGCVSFGCYDERWFAAELSPSYLAEKFLRKSWSPDVAADELGEMFGEEMRDEPDVERRAAFAAELEELSGRLRAHELGPDGLASELQDSVFLCDYDGLPGYDYPPSDLAWLVAIQRKFSELYQEMEK